MPDPLTGPEPMKEIRTTTDIHSTPEKVWGVLTDFGAYPQWNPFITKAGGALEPGEQLELQLEPPGSHPRMLRPTLLEADPTRELRWHGRLGFVGLLEAYHTVSIIPKGTNRTHVIARTTFSGPIVAFYTQLIDTNLREGFEGMCRALKARVQGPGGPGGT